MGLFGGKKKNDAIELAEAQRAREQQEIEQEFLKGITTLRDTIAQAVSRSNQAISNLVHAMDERCMCMAIRDRFTLVGSARLSISMK